MNVKQMTGTDVLLLLAGSIFSIFLALAVGFSVTNETDKAGNDDTASNEPTCTLDIPHADEYEFVCEGDTIEVWDAATGEYITSEQRCDADSIRAEDGSCVPADFYGPHEADETTEVHTEFKEEAK
jgi:hypothetical protein